MRGAAHDASFVLIPTPSSTASCDLGHQVEEPLARRMEPAGASVPPHACASWLGVRETGFLLATSDFVGDQIRSLIRTRKRTPHGSVCLRRRTTHTTPTLRASPNSPPVVSPVAPRRVSAFLTTPACRACPLISSCRAFSFSHCHLCACRSVKMSGVVGWWRRLDRAAIFAQTPQRP